MYFFDSWGQLWTTCPATHPAATAFGPTGVSRQADPAKAGLVVADDETPYTAASRAGRLVEADPDDCDSWATLAGRMAVEIRDGHAVIREVR